MKYLPPGVVSARPVLTGRGGRGRRTDYLIRKNTVYVSLSKEGHRFCDCVAVVTQKGPAIRSIVISYCGRVPAFIPRRCWRLPPIPTFICASAPASACHSPCSQQRPPTVVTETSYTVHSVLFTRLCASIALEFS